MTSHYTTGSTREERTHCNSYSNYHQLGVASSHGGACPALLCGTASDERYSAYHGSKTIPRRIWNDMNIVHHSARVSLPWSWSPGQSFGLRWWR